MTEPNIKIFDPNCRMCRGTGEFSAMGAVQPCDCYRKREALAGEAREKMLELAQAEARQAEKRLGDFADEVIDSVEDFHNENNTGYDDDVKALLEKISSLAIEQKKSVEPISREEIKEAESQADGPSDDELLPWWDPARSDFDPRKVLDQWGQEMRRLLEPRPEESIFDAAIRIKEDGRRLRRVFEIFSDQIEDSRAGYTIEVNHKGAELHIVHPGQDGGRGVNITISLTDKQRMELCDRLMDYKAGFNEKIQKLCRSISFDGLT